MRSSALPEARVFKTAWFAKAARKARISDGELCKAIREVMVGQADDLGGGIWKKRLDKNRHRSIILAKGRRYWMFEYLFAKKNRSNIDDSELSAFQRLARLYAELDEMQVERLLKNGDMKEICHEDKAQAET
jgi:hypothetical protein